MSNKITMLSIDWHALFVPSGSLIELVIRGSLVYLFLVVMMRVFRRNAGNISTPDLLVIVIIADAAQNGMAAEYHSITEGAVLIATLFSWNYGLDWLSYHSPAIRALLQPMPLLLIKDGRVQRRNLKSEMLTMDDLTEQLREHGVGAISEVRQCFLEADGHLSVLLRSPRSHPSS